MAENIKLTIYEHNTSEYPVLTLAYMGDAVLEILAREYILKNSGVVKPGQLVKASKEFITCEAQSDAVERILPLLSEAEQAVFKRGRNAKTHFTPKHGELIQYRRATGFEALMGYLYLSGRHDRAKELFLAAYTENTSDKDASPATTAQD